MFKRIVLVIISLLLSVIIAFGQTGDYTTNGYFYLPSFGESGEDAYNEYNTYMEIADNQIEANKQNSFAVIDTETELENAIIDVTNIYTNNDFDIADYTLIANIDTINEMETIWDVDVTTSTELVIALGDYYLKTAIDTQGEMETIWGVSLVNDGDLDLYYLKTAIDTIGEVETIWGVDITTSTEMLTYCETTQDYLKTSENNDSADNVANDNVESMTTAGASGTVPLSNGAGVLTMTDVWTEAENTAANYLPTASNNDNADDLSNNSINDLADVDTTGIADNKIIKYDLATSTWVIADDENTTYTSSDFNHDDLTGFVANEHIDWTTDQGATNIHSSNYIDTNTIYTGDTEIVVTGTVLSIGSGITRDTELSTALNNYYLKTDIDTIGEMETIWAVDITTSTEMATYCETTQDYLKTSENNDNADNLADNSINDLSDVDNTGWATGKILKFDASGNLIVGTDEGGTGAITFIGLTDTPADYTGAANKFLQVNGTPNAVVFDTISESDISDLGTTVAMVADKLSVFAPTTSAELAGVISDETGSGALVFGTSPHITTPTGIVKGDVGLGNVENTALSTWVGSTNITTLGTIETGTWNATAIADGKIASATTWNAKLANVVEDTTPQLGGQLQAGAHSINFTEQALTSGTAIAWDLGNSNKATLTAGHNFTITITAPSGALNAQLIITQDGTGSRVMDEIVTQKDEAIATDDVHTDTEIIDLTVDIPTGARIRFKTSAADLPAPLVVDTIYWAIRSSENHIKVATTKANAIAGTAVDLTDTGTGTHTVQQLAKWTGGTLGVLSTAAGSEDILSLTYKTADKQWYAQLSKDFK